MRLAAIRIPERDVDPRHLLVLEKDPDHLAQAEIGAERELSDALAVGVGVTVVPEILLQILAGALRVHEASTADLEHERVGLELAVLGVEVIAGGAIADERAIDGSRR